MYWDATDIRSLRRRLGWTQSDLARRVGCPVDEVQKWELGEAFPEPDYVNRLEYLNQQLDEISSQMSRQAIAESVMKEGGLIQVTKDDLPS